MLKSRKQQPFYHGNLSIKIVFHWVVVPRVISIKPHTLYVYLNNSRLQDINNFKPEFQQREQIQISLRPLYPLSNCGNFVVLRMFVHTFCSCWGYTFRANSFIRLVVSLFSRRVKQGNYFYFFRYLYRLQRFTISSKKASLQSCTKYLQQC